MIVAYYKKDRYGVADNIISDDTVRKAWQRLTELKTISGTNMEDLEDFVKAIGGVIKFEQVLPPEEE